MNIITKTYELPHSSVITKDILTGYVNTFWKDIYMPLNSSNNNLHLLLMCKVEFTDPALGYRTLADMRKVNFSDKNLYIEFLVERLGLLSDSYSVNPVNKIVFTYIVKDGLADDSRRLLQQPKYEVKAHAYNNYVLPLTMDPNKFGEVRASQSISDETTRYMVVNEVNYVFQIDVGVNINNVHILGATDLKWVDTKLSDNSFKREIGKNTIYIKDGVVVVKEKQLPAKAFRKIPVETKLTPINNFMCIDIVHIVPNCQYRWKSYTVFNLWL